MTDQPMNENVQVTIALPENLLARADELVAGGVAPGRGALLTAALEAYLTGLERGLAARSTRPSQVAEAQAAYLLEELEEEAETEYRAAEADVWTEEDEARLRAEAEKEWAEMEADWEAQPEYFRNGWPEELTPEMLEIRMRALEESYCIVKLDNDELVHDIMTNPMVSEWNLDWEQYGLQS